MALVDVDHLLPKAGISVEVSEGAKLIRLFSYQRRAKIPNRTGCNA